MVIRLLKGAKCPRSIRNRFLFEEENPSRNKTPTKHNFTIFIFAYARRVHAIYHISQHQFWFFHIFFFVFVNFQHQPFCFIVVVYFRWERNISRIIFSCLLFQFERARKREKEKIKIDKGMANRMKSELSFFNSFNSFFSESTSKSNYYNMNHNNNNFNNNQNTQIVFSTGH